MRHHRPVQLEIFYYPQTTTVENGPTFVVPYSQYWTTNQETSSDNFSGPDHLDFDFTYADRLEGHPDLDLRDQRLSSAITKLKWPLVHPHSVTIPAGSAVPASHNLYHRASRRTDPEHVRDESPRFMWRCWCYRTHEPSRAPAGTTLTSAFGA